MFIACVFLCPTCCLNALLLVDSTAYLCMMMSHEFSSSPITHIWVFTGSFSCFYKLFSHLFLSNCLTHTYLSSMLLLWFFSPPFRYCSLLQVLSLFMFPFCHGTSFLYVLCHVCSRSKDVMGIPARRDGGTDGDLRARPVRWCRDCVVGRGSDDRHERSDRGRVSTRTDAHRASGLLFRTVRTGGSADPEA